jgi:hypothetical protein
LVAVPPASQPSSLSQTAPERRNANQAAASRPADQARFTEGVNTELATPSTQRVPQRRQFLDEPQGFGRPKKYFQDFRSASWRKPKHGL